MKLVKIFEKNIEQLQSLNSNIGKELADLKEKYGAITEKVNELEIDAMNTGDLITELEKRNKMLLGENKDLQKRRKQAKEEISKLEGKLNKSFQSAREGGVILTERGDEREKEKETPKGRTNSEAVRNLRNRYSKLLTILPQ